MPDHPPLILIAHPEPSVLVAKYVKLNKCTHRGLKAKKVLSVYKVKKHLDLFRSQPSTCASYKQACLLGKIVCVIEDIGSYFLHQKRHF